MRSFFWDIFGIATALKVLLIPSYYSTDFEVHRNWLAITHSLPLERWYVDATSEWTLDYPPCFAYFEWFLSQIAKYVDAGMLVVPNLNYASPATVYFQRISVIVVDIVYALGVKRCLKALHVSQENHQHFTAEIMLLLNVGLIIVDHIHFQYNGMLFGILLFSISFLLEQRYLWSAFTFAMLLNFKHIFLYMAPAFGVYLLRFYCFGDKQTTVWRTLSAMFKLLVVGVTPFVLSFGPFYKQLPQIMARLFPFKRGLTHAYWAPNFWAVYNAADKALAALLRKKVEQQSVPSSTSGLVQDTKHVVLPTITPAVTFALTVLFMLPILIKLCFYTGKSDAKIAFMRALVLCACSSFIFGWHVHEKAILMCLIPICFLALLHIKDAKYTVWLSVAGYFSLFPLLFEIDLLVVRYSLYGAYIAAMCAQLMRIHKTRLPFNMLEQVYLYGFIGLPIYEHIIGPLLGLNKRLPFMPLLLTSLYASIGVITFFIGYYCHACNIKLPAWKDNRQAFKATKTQQKVDMTKIKQTAKPTKGKTKHKLKQK